MKYVVIISHGDFAPGLHSAVKMMVGERKELLSASLKDGQSTDDFATQLKEVLQPITHEDSIILMCDILGGSPLTTSLSILSELGHLEKTMVFTGMNMPLAMTAVIMKDNMDDETLRQTLLFEGREALTEFKLDVNDSVEDDI